jgi:hypothetical protein
MIYLLIMILILIYNNLKIMILNLIYKLKIIIFKMNKKYHMIKSQKIKINQSNHKEKNLLNIHQLVMNQI